MKSILLPKGIEKFLPPQRAQENDPAEDAEKSDAWRYL